ncbi:hypothetical protein Pcinc_009213 [Petrolisthes cinctipes]|uniref:Uncharacterized protein n=1 Tax=Petrolisthes cinctipes TaxID=88211 RepID=A0AAE1KWJ7_PETCI|nr:hypothetical protein Pcinc_009213 [Petrolisthes cinctipes]
MLNRRKQWNWKYETVEHVESVFWCCDGGEWQVETYVLYCVEGSQDAIRKYPGSSGSRGDYSKKIGDCLHAGWITSSPWLNNSLFKQCQITAPKN